MRCVLVAAPPTEVGIATAKSPFWRPTAEAVSARQGTPGPLRVLPPKRYGSPRLSREPPPTRALPKRCADARHAVRDLDDSSHGVRPPSAFEPGRSLCRFASPAPSALRVSHPRSGLSPPGPRGFVSRHIRPWGLVTAFRAFPSQPAVTPLGALCSLVVPAGYGSPRDELKVGFRPCLSMNRCDNRLTGFAELVARATPTDRSDIDSYAGSTEVVPSTSERSKPLPGREARSAQNGATGSPKVARSIVGQARACDFRALLRLRVRTRTRAVRRALEPMLS